MTTILVTGATGMVGSHFARRAAELATTCGQWFGATRTAGRSTGFRLSSSKAISRSRSRCPRHLRTRKSWFTPPPTSAIGGRRRNIVRSTSVALEHMIHAAARSPRLARWVQISSLGVYPARHHYGTDESVPPDAVGLDGYTRTKAEAEVLLAPSWPRARLSGRHPAAGIHLRPWRPARPAPLRREDRHGQNENSSAVAIV